MAFADPEDLVRGRESHPREIDNDRWPSLGAAVEAGRMNREETVEHMVRVHLKGVAQEHLASGE